MKFNDLKKGDFLYYAYSPDANAYIYINNINNNVTFDELKIFHRKKEFIYSYNTVEKSLWNNKDFVFAKTKKCEVDIKSLIKYIFEYGYWYNDK